MIELRNELIEKFICGSLRATQRLQSSVYEQQTQTINKRRAAHTIRSPFGSIYY